MFLEQKATLLKTDAYISFSLNVLSVYAMVQTEASILCAQGPKGTAHQDMQIKKKGSGGVFSTNCKSKIMDKWECVGVCGRVQECAGMCGNV